MFIFNAYSLGHTCSRQHIVTHMFLLDLTDVLLAVT